MEAELDRVERSGTIECPDCGERANLTVVEFYHRGFKDDTSLHTIDCPNCDYYEFLTVGPDY